MWHFSAHAKKRRIHSLERLLGQERGYFHRSRLVQHVLHDKRRRLCFIMRPWRWTQRIIVQSSCPKSARQLPSLRIRPQMSRRNSRRSIEGFIYRRIKRRRRLFGEENSS